MSSNRPPKRPSTKIWLTSARNPAIPNSPGVHRKLDYKRAIAQIRFGVRLQTHCAPPNLRPQPLRKTWRPGATGIRDHGQPKLAQVPKDIEAALDGRDDLLGLDAIGVEHDK